jgi:energy-coupling factor transporter ATP-binding protein EcfA2/uncharacterized protein (DUF1778 family)
MTTGKNIFRQSRNNVQRLGLNEIPFTESPTDLQSGTLQNIFTGREKELGQIFNLFQSRERRRIMVYGRLGIGKSAFLLEVLGVLRSEIPEMLTTYISLPANLDLPTTALIALARAMPEDEWAQQQLYQMGIPIATVLKERSTEVSASLGIGGKLGKKDLPITKPQYPTVSLETLLERAQKRYPQGVLIAIDDLDKQNPSALRQLMHDAQGMLKGRAWFMFTGHPTGITGDLLTTERGLFDLALKLEELDFQTTYQMLINYLNSARINNDCTDPKDPRSVLPFLPETAKRFCEVSLGKPRLFNRLGNTILSTAADLQATLITPEVLNQALKVAAPTLRQQAALNVQEERVRALLQRRGSLSDETITMEDLEQLGFRSFSDVLPLLERLEEADLAHQTNQDDAKAYVPTPLPSEEDESEALKVVKRNLFLAEVELSNIRCFETLKLTFSNEVNTELTHLNTILGDNASGKTTLLRSIALGLCPESDAAALMRELPGDFVRSGATEGYIKITLCPENIHGVRYTITTKFSKLSENSLELVRQTTEPKNFPWSDIFICAYGSYRSAQAETSYESYRSFDAVQSLFDYKTSLQNPELASRRQDIPTRKLLEQKLLKILMLDMPDIPDRPDRPAFELKFDKTGLLLVGPHGNHQPIASHSDGYRSTAQWVLDFLSWAIYAERLTSDPGSEIGGILLIDEIEQHLHPRWQRHIVRRLKEQFPSTQIITTTHTPLVAAGVADMEDGLLIGLESDSEGQTIVRKIGQQELVGKRADQVLTSEAFGLITSRSPGSEEKIDRYALLKSKHNRSGEEENELESLRVELEDGLSLGENKVARIAERIIDQAMEEAINNVSPDLLDLEIKRQLHELFGSETLK